MGVHHGSRPTGNASHTSIERVDNTYAFTSFTFGTGAQTGEFGPTLSEALAAYDTVADPWLNNTAFFNVINGRQLWTVPVTGTYRITAAGSIAATRLANQGRGAVIRGDFTLTKDDKYNIIVGQKERQISPNSTVGGGGGSFVVKDHSPITSTPTGNILIIAGGGGGQHGSGPSTQPRANADANFGTSGDAGSPSGGSAGTSGNGGSHSGIYSYMSGSSIVWAGNGGAGGAGFLTVGSGRTNYQYGDDGFRPEPYRSNNCLMGGGRSGAKSSKGGFGGGGFTWYQSGWGGGGGGYSGGGTGANLNYYGYAGGGGSINNGTNTSNIGLNTSEGYVTIEYIPT